MKKYSLFLLLIVLLISVKVSVAQEEVYEQPAQIIDTLETEEKVTKRGCAHRVGKEKREIKSSETWRQFWIAIWKLYVCQCVAYCWLYGGERQTGIRRRANSDLPAIQIFQYQRH